MDFFSTLIIIIGLIALNLNTIFTDRKKIVWRYIIVRILIFLLGLLIFNFIINQTNFNYQKNHLSYHLTFFIGFLFYGTYYFLQNKKYNIKKALEKIITFSVFLFTSLGISLLLQGKNSILIYSSSIVCYLSFYSFFHYYKIYDKDFLTVEFLSLLKLISAVYLILVPFLPGNFATKFELLAPENIGIEYLYYIVIVIVLSVFFLAGFFINPKNKRK